MKIIHILNELKFSGAEIMYVDAASIFQSEGCELTVVATAKELGEFAPFFEHAGYTVLHKPAPPNGKSKLAYYKELTKIFQDGGYDIVHIHSSTMRWCASYCAWKAGCNVVYTFHNVFKSKWYSYPIHLLNRLSAKYIFGCKFQTISDSVYENELKYYHNQTEKIYNWYGSNRFYPATSEVEKMEVRSKLGIANDALVLISVGGCSMIKRHHEVLKAMVYVLKEYPNTLYLHLGEGVTLNEEITLAKELGIFKNVRFEGNQTNVREYLIASDIYLMPSRFEGIPITTIEAMGCGIPTILYDVPGLCDFNNESECSVIIKEDYKILATAICNLHQDPIKKIEISNNAKALVDRIFNIKTNVKKIIALYEKSH